MVKADPTRNYYADLKVSANASENEIRKAFRTLALQYHPDRNPGHEAEFVVKFQEIQAAHEVLCDQTQRAKYDAERRKYRNLTVPTNTPNTPRTRPPPPPRNAHTTTTPSGSYYRAPPPKPSPQSQRPPPPQHHTTYTTGADRFTNKNFRPPPTAQRPAQDAEARANVFTAWQKMKQPRAEEPRQYSPGAQSTQSSAPNAQNTQNNPNGSPFGRSQSTRVPSSKKGFDPGTLGGDEGQARSAYRNYARPAPTPPSSTTPPHPPLPMQGTQTNEVPYSEANRVRTPYYSTVAGERTSMFEGMGRSSSVRNSPTHGNRASPMQDAGAHSDSGRRQQRSSYGGKSTQPFPQMYPNSSDDESESEVFRTGNKHRGPPPHRTKPSPPTWGREYLGGPQQARQSDGVPRNVPNSFKSRSEESINMKFSPSDWHGKFEGSADYFAPNMQKGSNTRGRTSPTRGRPSQKNPSDRKYANNSSMGPPPVSPFPQPLSQSQSYPIPPPPPGPPPNMNFPPPAEAASHATKFSPQFWAETFANPGWVNADARETSPRRAAEAAKRAKAARKPSLAQNGTTKTQDQPDTSRPRYQAFAETTNGDADAMDIDSNTPPIPKPVKRPNRSSSTSARINTATATAAPNGFATAPSSATTAKPPGFGLNGLAGMGNPDLFVPTQSSGLGMNELGDNLPFNSKPSSSHPTKPIVARQLKFPDMPQAPPPPVKLDQQSADEYFNRMNSYVKAYKSYCKTLTSHFTARNTELESLEDRFIHQRGETTKKLGFASYLAKMKEDEEVLETWKFVQGKHIQALEACEETRNKAIRLNQTPLS